MMIVVVAVRAEELQSKVYAEQFRSKTACFDSDIKQGLRHERHEQKVQVRVGRTFRTKCCFQPREKKKKGTPTQGKKEKKRKIF